MKCDRTGCRKTATHTSRKLWGKGDTILVCDDHRPGSRPRPEALRHLPFCYEVRPLDPSHGETEPMDRPTAAPKATEALRLAMARHVVAEATRDAAEADRDARVPHRILADARAALAALEAPADGEADA